MACPARDLDLHLQVLVSLLSWNSKCPQIDFIELFIGEESDVGAGGVRAGLAPWVTPV